MKKIMLWILVMVCVLASVEAVFAAYDEDYDSYSKARRAKAVAFFRKSDLLVKDVSTLANKIVKNNKPAFEVKLTKQEQSPYPGDKVVWNRVWAKDKTLVFGFAGKDKNFEAVYLVTADPDFIFSGNIRVGASTKVLERFFSDTMSNIGTIKGRTITVNGPHWGGSDADAIVQIICMDGLITEIMFNWAYGISFFEDYSSSKKALDFANKQARQMGLSELE